MVKWGLLIVLLRLSMGTWDEDHLRHVFAVGVLGEALVDFLILLWRDCRVDHVPESNCSIRRASHKLGQGFLTFTAWLRRRLLVVADLEAIVHYLNVMDRARVWVHASEDCDGFELSDVPHKHHSVTVKGNSSIVDIVDGARNDIGKLSCLALWYFNAPISCKKIGRTQGWRLAKTQ